MIWTRKGKSHKTWLGLPSGPSSPCLDPQPHRARMAQMVALTADARVLIIPFINSVRATGAATAATRQMPLRTAETGPYILNVHRTFSLHLLSSAQLTACWRPSSRDRMERSAKRRLPSRRNRSPPEAPVLPLPSRPLLRRPNRREIPRPASIAQGGRARPDTHATSGYQRWQWLARCCRSVDMSYVPTVDTRSPMTLP